MLGINSLQITSKSILFLFLFSFGSFSFSQVDSVDVTIHFDLGIDPYDSVTVDVMHIDLSIHDIDFLGEVLVTLYEPTSGFPLSKIKMTKAELELESLISGSDATIKIYGLDPTLEYNIESLVRNYQGGNFPLINSTYTPQ